MKIQWPQGKRFAFTVFDDTDLSSPGNFEAVYDCLSDLGFRTTKSVWPTSGSYRRPKDIQGSTCEDPDYLKYVLELQRRGFEIAFHNSFDLALPREEIRAALDQFKKLFGHDPRSMSNHASSEEGIYWGSARLSGLARLLYGLKQGLSRHHQGHLSGKPYFWGDLCRERVEYVRNFVYSDINTLNVCPQMPYHDPKRPYVSQWFASTEGPKIDTYLQALSDENQDRLEEQGGACIMYTHFAAGFQSDGKLNSEFRRLMTRLSQKNGWFVPVSELLDYIRKQRGEHVITSWEREMLQWKWLFHKFRVGGTS
jgi:hypothetical protein